MVTPEPEEPQVEAGEARPPSGPHQVARAGIELYRNINKLDRWGGGGFGLATIVKIAGWAGLIAILAALVVKLRTVEQQLDPVAKGVEQLRAELDAARAGVQSQAGSSEAALQQLGESAKALDLAVAKASQTEVRAREDLQGSTTRAQALQQQLDAELQQAKALSDQATAIAAQLADLQKAVGATRGGLDSSGSQTQSALGQVQSDLAAMHKNAQTLSGAMAALKVDATQTELDKVAASAQELRAALEADTAHARELDQVIQARLAAEKARKPPTDDGQ